MARTRTTYTGEPGTVWTNETGTVQFQFHCNWHNSCGVCAQMDGQIGASWPIPLHRGCKCHQTVVRPGAQAQPFTDFHETISKLDHVQQSRVVGRSNLDLINKGVVKWEDVVTRTRVRDLREVVAKAGLSVQDMVKAGVQPRIATEAFATVHTPAHELAEAKRRELLDQLHAKGLQKDDVKRALAERLAARVGITSGPSGPGPLPITPTTPKPPPVQPPPVLPAKVKKTKPTPLPLPIPLIAGGSPEANQAIFLTNLGVKPEVVAKVRAGFPESLAGLEVIKTLGGSTGALLVRDPVTGRQFVRKAGGNAGHLLEESYADAAYKALGVRVPDSKIYEHNGKPVKLAEFHEGKSLAELKASNPAAYAEAVKALKQDFVADALLGNWDVIGLSADNILVAKGGAIYRIDNGGSLRYRAQGAKKSASQWSGDLGELQTMRDPKINPSAAAIFGGLTDAEIQKQAAAVLKKQDALLAATPKELHATLKARLKTLEKVAKGEPAVAPKPVPPKPKPSTPPPAAPPAVASAPKPVDYGGWKPPELDHKAIAEAKALTEKFKAQQAAESEAAVAAIPGTAKFKAFGGIREMEDWGVSNYKQWAETLTPAETRSLKLYAGEIFKEMNGILRGTLKDSDLKYGASRATIQTHIDQAEAALVKAKTPNDVVGYRGVKDFKTMGIPSLAALTPGSSFTEKGFSSVSLNQDKAKHFAYNLGDDAKDLNPVLFRVNIPKGSTGAYLNAGELSNFDDERELLFPPKAEYKVVGHGKPTMQAGVEIPVVILERIN